MLAVTLLWDVSRTFLARFILILCVAFILLPHGFHHDVVNLNFSFVNIWQRARVIGVLEAMFYTAPELSCQLQFLALRGRSDAHRINTSLNAKVGDDSRFVFIDLFLLQIPIVLRNSLVRGVAHALFIFISLWLDLRVVLHIVVFVVENVLTRRHRRWPTNLTQLNIARLVRTNGTRAVTGM